MLVMNLRTQRFTLHILHRDEVEAFSLADFVDVRDVRMIERSRGGRLLFEATHAILIRSYVERQDFQRDFAREARVLREIDLTHTTGANEGDDLVTTERCFGREIHRVAHFSRLPAIA